MRTYALVLALALLAVPLQSAVAAKSYSSTLMNAAINHDLEQSGRIARNISGRWNHRTGRGPITAATSSRTLTRQGQERTKA